MVDPAGAAAFVALIRADVAGRITRLASGPIGIFVGALIDSVALLSPNYVAAARVGLCEGVPRRSAGGAGGEWSWSVHDWSDLVSHFTRWNGRRKKIPEREIQPADPIRSSTVSLDSHPTRAYRASPAFRS